MGSSQCAGADRLWGLQRVSVGPEVDHTFSSHLCTFTEDLGREPGQGGKVHGGYHWHGKAEFVSMRGALEVQKSWEHFNVGCTVADAVGDSSGLLILMTLLRYN